jgi:hypothetical protein
VAWGCVDVGSRRIGQLPNNHSPEFAPVVEPTLTTGAEPLVVTAWTRLGARYT